MLRLVALMIVAVLVIGGANYALALAGEPRALWLFRDVLGLIA